MVFLQLGYVWLVIGVAAIVYKIMKERCGLPMHLNAPPAFFLFAAGIKLIDWVTFKALPGTVDPKSPWTHLLTGIVYLAVCVGWYYKVLSRVHKGSEAPDQPEIGNS